MINRLLGLVSGLLVVLAVAAWIIFLRPQVLGGPAAYILVSGESMQPTLASGTLVVVMRQSRYEVGEIVAYRIPDGDPAAGRNVIHRIVEGSAEAGFVMRGDNAAASDLWRPKPDDILGSAQIVIPEATLVIMFLRSPVVVASLTAALAVYLVLGFWTTDRRRVAATS